MRRPYWSAANLQNALVCIVTVVGVAHQYIEELRGYFLRIPKRLRLLLRGERDELNRMAV